MAVKLKNGNLSVLVETAGEKYTGSRFDWNGTVSSLKFDGIQLLGQEKPRGQRNNHIFGRGLHNEFGIRQCIGYEDAATDGLFPKIGTGWLKKDGKPYFFYTQYDVEHIKFSHEENGTSETICTCDSDVKNGYGFHYVKTISLEESSMTIQYQLENIGSKPLVTNEYVHNFFLPGGGVFKKRQIDEDFSLEFGWAFDVKKLSENVRSDGVLQINAAGSAIESESNASNVSANEARIQVIKIPQEEFFLGGIWQARLPAFAKSGASCAHWTLNDRKTGISITESDDFKPDGCDLWGYHGAICPEMFFAFTLNSGDIVSWKRTYSFSKRA